LPESVPELLPHSYTNQTTRDGSAVAKAYQGPGAARRCATEACVLRWLSGVLPVPTVLSATDTSLQLSFMPGVHGQDLIAAGSAGQVLRACGLMLHRIHQVDVRPDLVSGRPDLVSGRGNGAVLVHGDFGPNNVLLDADARAVVAVLDWEWAHAGDPVEDLAWCEWIVRMHHPSDVGSLDQFFLAYGDRPPWQARHAAMLARCRELLVYCQEWQRSVQLWRDRLAMVESWAD
jgi:aminoglycoside phosphotransferase